MRLTKILDKRTHFNFVGTQKIALVITLLMFLGAGFAVMQKGFNYGIDFAGGVLVEIKAEGALDPDKVREKMQNMGLRDVMIQPMGTDGTEMMIHVPTNPEHDEKAQMELLKKVQAELGEGIEYRKIEMVGPKVGDELKFNSIIAAVLAMLAITMYIWFRFEWPFAVMALAGLAHDILLTVGLLSVLQINIDLTIIAALLTAAGYSVNDTVVCYDRIRDNLRKYRKMPINEVLNNSANETLGRTILTSLSTLVAVLALFFLGGEVLHGFATIMLFGVVIGTYSTLYISVPFLSKFNLRKIIDQKDAGPAIP